jgi:GWxTD domain-containing protein
MNKHFTFILLLVFLSTSSIAANLKAYFTYCTFNSPENGPYIETYLSVIGNSAIYKKTDASTFQSTIEITLIFKQGEEIIKFKKYNLLSPEISDSLLDKENFMDEQRISLPNGKYEFEIIIKDLYSDDSPFKSTQILTVDYPLNSMSISDIELIESLKKTTHKSIITKSGYDIIPYTSDYYPESFEKIAFYSEIYNADKVLGENENYLITYFIESFETNKIVGNYKSFVKELAKPVNVILKSFVIETLPSGNYNLVIEARNKKNELLSNKKIFFQRSNPKSTPLLVSNDYLNSFVATIGINELDDYIKSIEPISTHIEINFAHNQLKGKDEELMRQYFYNFWITRNSLDPETEWNNYAKRVGTTNKLFATAIKKGYETDRGIVFLKYGKPNSRTEVKSEPSSYPYEIWHYHKVEGFSNRKFVFYSTDLVSNDYPLLHSDMPGHIYNAQWKVQLHKRTNQPRDMDEENNDSHYGGRANDYFNNPR